jgi:hypothetical protein
VPAGASDRRRAFERGPTGIQRTPATLDSTPIDMKSKSIRRSY